MPPSVKDAVHFLAISLTDDYRQRTLKLWRECYGEVFVIEVEKAWAKRKGKSDGQSVEA